MRTHHLDRRVFRRVHTANPRHRDAVLLGLVPPGSTVLDVGCAEGRLARELNRKGCTVAGIEVSAHLADIAESRAVEVVRGDVEDPKCLGQMAGRSFDVILLADVLEHLRDPWLTLSRLSRYLSPTGQVVACVPNVVFLSSRLRLLRGQFEYDSAGGTFDLGHLRFFNRKTTLDLFASAGLAVERVLNVPFTFRGERLAAAGGMIHRAALWWGGIQQTSADLVPGLLAMSFIVTARRRGF